MANTTTKSFEKAKDAAGQAYDKGKDAMSSVGEAVSSAAGAVGKTADNMTSAAGSGVKSLGDTIAAHTPHEGMLGSASQAVAGTVKQAGEYMEREGLSGMFEDLTGVIRNHPVPAVLIGIGIGFLIGRTLGSS
jgi:hypothetical protein